MRTVSCYVYEPLGGDYNCETCGPTCNEVMAGWERDAEGEGWFIRLSLGCTGGVDQYNLSLDEMLEVFSNYDLPVLDEIAETLQGWADAGLKGIIS